VKNKLDHPSTFATPPRNTPLRGGKWVLYEGGIRVPFIVRGPGVKAGAQCDVPVVGWDLLPTLADLAGYPATLPADLDGGSFRALLASGQGKVARAEVPLIFHRFASGYPHSVIRVGDEKLVKIWKTGALELYDLKADPGERTDLASRRPERVRVLHEQLMAYFKRMDAEVLHGYGKAKEEN
jgi:arylsulfatase A-like enzyme